MTDRPRRAEIFEPINRNHIGAVARREGNNDADGTIRVRGRCIGAEKNRKKCEQTAKRFYHVRYLFQNRSLSELMRGSRPPPTRSTLILSQEIAPHKRLRAAACCHAAV